MVGLIVAVLIAALISTLDSGLNSFSTILTLDIYVKSFRPGATIREIRWLGRAATVLAAGIAVLFAMAMQGMGKSMFDLLQSLIAFVSPPMAAVFMAGVLWRRATGAAAIFALIVGSLVSLSLGACCISGWPYEGFWPHYLLLSFYLFLGIGASIVVVSLLTKKGPQEQELPTLREAYARAGTAPKLVWCLWGVLAMIMLTIYAVL